MSSEFNPNEFRRLRAGEGDAPKPPATPVPEVVPVPLPSFQGLQEYVPETAQQTPIAAAPVYEAAAEAVVIPDAVPNPYAAALETKAPAAVPAAVPNPYAAALTPAAPPVMTPVPALTPPPQTQTPQVQAVHVQAVPAPAIDTPAPTKTSLIAGLLSKLKKTEPETHVDTPMPVQASPVEYRPGVTASAPEQAEQPIAPQAAMTPPAVPTFTASVPVEITARTKPYLPVWAALALGGLMGVILTFTALALMGDKPENTLEARFGSNHQQTLTVPADVALSEMGIVVEEEKPPTQKPTPAI